MVILTLLSVLWTHSPSFAKVDEVRDNRGRIRPAYKPIEAFIRTASDKQQKNFEKFSQEAFDGDYPLGPLPRILSEDEYDFIRRGVDQRARALLAFLKDHFGERRYLKADIIPPNVVERALYRAGELGYQGLINSDLFSFLYGPDIVRAEHNGKLGWFVLEDNTGYVGGMGDLVVAHELTLALHPQLKSQLTVNHPFDFYRTLARHMQNRAQEKGGIAVIYQSQGASDNEGRRVNEIFTSLGILSVGSDSGRTLVEKDDQIFVKGTNGKSGLTKVGFVLLEDELAWIDFSTPASFNKLMHDLALLYLEPGAADTDSQERVRLLLAEPNPKTKLPDYKKIRTILIESQFIPSKETVPAPGLIDAFLKGNVFISSSPSTDFLGDKELFLYVDKFIRFFLNEKPLLPQLPARRFATKAGQFDEKAVSEIFADLKKWVIKRFDGRGGSTVWIGRTMTSADADRVKKLIEMEPTAYKAEPALKIVQIGDNIGDIRPIAFVDNKGVIVANTPWGRGAPAKGSGKVNIAMKGHVMAVIVGKPCEDYLR